MRLRVNTILLADAYKYTHWRQLRKNKRSYGYIESRGTKIQVKGILVDYNRLACLQGFIKDYLVGKVIKGWMIQEAERLLGEVFGFPDYFNKEGFQRIIDVHGGRIPVKIKAVPEGKRIPLGNALVTVESTDPELPWVQPWIETMLLRAVWYPTAVATVSSLVRDMEKKFAAICGASLNPFFLNDFGARGVSSHESAEIGGTAHLFTYLGTDTVEAIRWAKHHYGKTATGYSVYASEHSTTTSYGKDGEVTAIKHFLMDIPKTATGSFVADSYDPFNFVTNIIGKECKELILNRDGVTVIRPDSGDPIVMSEKMISLLWDAFGGTTREVNGKIFKILNPKVRVIYGDGINLQSIHDICENLIANGWSIENICFGMGGKLLQGVDRDTFKNALKLTELTLEDGSIVEIFKDPITDPGKRSKTGELKVIEIDGTIKTVRVNDIRYTEYPDILELVFLDGYLKRWYKFDTVRHYTATT